MPPTPAFSTTTVTLAPTVSAAPQSPNANVADKADTIPLGAIVGSVAGGILLALISLLGWMAWRKTTLHKRAKEKAASLTRQNTLRNSSDKLRPYSPAWVPGPTSTKVKFAATPEKGIDRDIPSSADHNAEKTKMEFKLKKGDNGLGGKASMTPSRPKALKAPRSLKQHHSTSEYSSELGNVKLPIPPPPTLPSRLPRHKASTRGCIP
ncbi:hypothetical protein L218DRAFT_642418 [Marasmius fiardii PR-910]|nr:hypothetical protein L218DRAFT_642418 [Marasmius fiardii PR-910]